MLYIEPEEDIARSVTRLQEPLAFHSARSTRARRQFAAHSSCRLAFWGVLLAASQDLPTHAPQRKQMISEIGGKGAKRVTFVVAVVGVGRFRGDIADVGAAVGGGGGGDFGW